MDGETRNKGKESFYAASRRHYGTRKVYFFHFFFFIKLNFVRHIVLFQWVAPVHHSMISIIT